jgi:hypothetical protein
VTLSFIEKNKAWVLPLLGLGVLGVAYMNYRTFQGDKPATAEVTAPQPAQPAAQAAAEAPAALPPAAAEAAKPEGSGELWADLQVFAVLPGNLAQEDILKDRARVAIVDGLGEEPQLALGRPVEPALAKPLQKPAQAGSVAGPGALPELEFLVHGPQGSYAWFNGSAYQVGESVRGSGYTVNRIGPTYVELSGPEGRHMAYTNPSFPFDKKPSNPAEAP